MASAGGFGCRELTTLLQCTEGTISYPTCGPVHCMFSLWLFVFGHLFSFCFCPPQHWWTKDWSATLASAISIQSRLRKSCPLRESVLQCRRSPLFRFFFLSVDELFPFFVSGIGVTSVCMNVVHRMNAILTWSTLSCWSSARPTESMWVDSSLHCC